MASSSTSGQIRSQPENAFDRLGPYSAPKSTEPWDIFINHRGSDVKYTLATDIYNKLHSMGFSVFLDVEALQVGDSFPAEVQHAMATATLHIAIFSPNYAQSPWCLAELTFMLKTGAQIIPIFYHVDPSDLRHIEKGKGIYADAFLKHLWNDRYTSEKLHEWKRALEDCSYQNGYPVKDSRDEATVLKNIVNDALKITKRKGLVSVAKHPVGLDELVQDFESLAREETAKIRGIVGVGGSGKTTLAKEIFNRKFSSFERCSFVFDVRDAASRSALPEKQKELLRDLGVDDLLLKFHDVDQGKVLLANRLTNSVRALIVLDDVDHIDQLDALFPNKDDLGSLSSMIIVTTRDLRVLESWRLSHSCIYRIPRLDKSHAEQLFCSHAFFQPSPPAEFQTLVEEFLKACDGLPLSLKVLGAQLCGNDSKAYWKSQLNKISRRLPLDIKRRLQVSYDALDEEDKKMFLDVACFLIGEEKNKAIAVWDGSGWSGLLGLKALENKCLVELVEEKVVFRFKEKWETSTRIRMHDQLRDMGREIASRQSPYRLWCPQQVHDKIKLSTKRNPVRGILPADSFVVFKEYMNQLTGKAIRRSKRLRFSYGLQILSVNGNEFTEEFASLSQELVWLRWEDFPLKNVPPWLTLKNLMVLELHCAYELEQLWQDNAEPPLKLSELILTGCRKLQRFPSSFKNLQDLKSLAVEFVGSSLSGDHFCVLPSLQNLQLSSLELSSLPDDFGNLTSLMSLSLESCVQLSRLPDSFRQLIHLTDLNLSSCEKLSSLPGDFGYLTRLTNLNMQGCSKLTMLPDSFSQLIHLTDLNMQSCSKLTMLPNSFSQLIHLTDLDLSYCTELSSLPDGFGSLTSLRNLNMRSCLKLTMLPDSFSQLIHLTDLDLSNFIYMLDLNISNFMELSSLPDDFGSLTSLRNLNMRNCSKLTMLPDSFSQLIHLTDLDLAFCTELSSLPDNFGSLTSLRNLNMHHCLKLTMLPDSFSQLIHLTDLDLSNLIELSSLPDDFGSLTSLRNLNMYSCSKLTMLPDSFSQLIHLTDLDLSKFRELSSLPDDFGSLKSLRNLIVDSCSKLTMLPDSFSQLIQLEILKLSMCKMLSSLPDNFGNLSSLRSISLSYNERLCGLPDSFSRLHLTDLDLSGCKMISSLPEMLPVSLNKLKIWSCNSLKSVRCISHGLRNLETLDIYSCMQIEELPSFTGLASLKKITILNCPGVEKMEGLEHVREFVVLGCPKVEKIEGLEHVWRFEMRNCPKVEKIQGLEHAKSLKVLTLKTSWREAGIQSLGNVERLKVLTLECETISALKPCIQSIKGKECAREVWIKGSAIRLEEPIVNHLEAISNLKVFKPPVVDCGSGDSDDSWDGHSDSDDNWDGPEISDFISYLSDDDDDDDVSYLYYVEQEEGNGGERKVVCMCYTENSYTESEDGLDDYFPPKRAIKVSGKREGVLEAFYQILELLV